MRYLLLLPILGLAISAAVLFIFGGVGLVQLVYELRPDVFGPAHDAAAPGQGVVVFEIVEYVHTFLVGTVLYITAVGLYQLFIQEIEFPTWLKIRNTEELELNLIGVTVVVLAVNFMGATFAEGSENLLQYGAGIALPIAALGVFVGLRAWSVRIGQETDASGEQRAHTAAQKPTDGDIPDEST